ncbi:Phosphate-selective porin O and P [Salinimicrobium catena]|uniref:Phosphate-selective porin O and P n=1 Tax=Salinimicrobium catena TaxID=390640 RepID=A0A1H5PD55_9FLAO|nr:porin [Salinimicrobium catena]SDL77290.1 Phosphate-selective porin O and P [Salinimicrobium catena]SEF11021.1 Phosphate-selective porin O and P [Salinimicrobium catena]
MKKFLLSLAIGATTAVSVAQTQQDSITFDPQYQQNSAQRVLSANNDAVTLGAYGEVTYNQPEGDNGELDVQRLVMLLGYQFTDKVQFFTEIEFEHVEEVYVEQAFVNYNIANNVNLRAGLMLVPMGIINEYHEPTTFNGVERPAIAGSIVPTTWREIGVGVNGRINSASLAYQAYIFNGFQSTTSDGTGLLKGSNGLRGGRQKGIKSTVNTPNLSAKLEYFGILGMRLGLAGYFGRTQAADEVDMLDGADIGMSMVGLDARYVYQRFTARGEFIYASLTDTDDYNALTGRDLGSALSGWYAEAAYNLLPMTNKQKLFAFARYEDYDTHADTAGSLVENPAYDRNDITMGLSYHIAPGVVFKGDYQIKDNAVEGADAKNQLNFGVGVWF